MIYLAAFDVSAIIVTQADLEEMRRARPVRVPIDKLNGRSIIVAYESENVMRVLAPLIDLDLLVEPPAQTSNAEVIIRMLTRGLRSTCKPAPTDETAVPSDSKNGQGFTVEDKALIKKTKKHMRVMSPEERLAFIRVVMEEYCSHCGYNFLADGSGCRCWRDE